jgi:iron complex transport system permease protein
MVTATAPEAAAPPPLRRPAAAIGALAAATAALALAGLALGPVGLSPQTLLAALTGEADPAATAILLQIRAPRVALALAVGAGLALSGVALQGVLRNPLADPGLIGVTGGAALGAALTIVLGGLVVGAIPAGVRAYLLPLAAFVGGALATALVYAVARRAGETSVATLILAGVAVNAVAGAAIGALVYVSDDAALRDLTFWTMGGLGGADWPTVIAASAAIAAALFGLSRLARALDLLQLGERAAFHAGLEVESAKRAAAGWSALAVGAATAAAGPIGFIGLVAPHLARLGVGPGHRLVAPTAALGGAALLLAADLAARTAVPPAEPPVGLATSLIGGPFFLWLLLRSLRRGDALG